MTKDEILAAQAICDAATPGPWKSDSCGDVWTEAEFSHDPIEGCYKSIGTTAVFRANESNQIFIAFARAALPKALSALQAAQEDLKDSRRMQSPEIEARKHCEEELHAAEAALVELKSDLSGSVIDKLNVRIMILREALEFYGDKENYSENGIAGDCSKTDGLTYCDNADFGARARAALGGKEVE